MKTAFTMIEMLVVIAIIAILTGITVGSYNYVTKLAQKTRGVELVSNVATALNALYLRENRWPPSLLNEANGEGRLTARAAACLAVHKLMSLTYTTREEEGEQVYVLSGLDRCGIVTPWATAVLKKLPAGGSPLAAKVPSGGTIRDHQLHFAIDDDGDGIVVANLGSGMRKIRATAVVWSWGMNGKEDDYKASTAGRGNADDIYSWNVAQEVK